MKSKDDKKNTYDYDDIIALNLDKKTWLVSKPIGQKFVDSRRQHSLIP